jgi:acyl-CoA ligase (AMP-forming) (exosortase A-associated)
MAGQSGQEVDGTGGEGSDRSGGMSAVMTTPFLLHHLITGPAGLRPDAIALVDAAGESSYATLAAQVAACAAGLLALGLERGDRVGIYLDKRAENVVACFAAAAAGLVFVPVNPVLKPAQVAFILRDCNVRVLITSGERLGGLAEVLGACPDLRQVVAVGQGVAAPAKRWEDMLGAPARPGHRVVDTDLCAILYTSGSTGTPKGVMLTHRNLVAGALSVASYLENGADDVLLAALPLSFDAGFSQLTTAFSAGARVVLINYLMPRDVLQAVVRHRVTGLTAVPPLWIQLAQLRWPAAVSEHLRYIANTGGRMPRETLATLRAQLPGTRPFLMYGLTEAFRATYLPPEEADRRPDSIGKAIPNSEVLVLREDGSPCATDEPGELVQRGALVAQGYWNDPARTAERFRPLPAAAKAGQGGLVLPEIAVFSGDTVRRDAEGFLYFIGRRDEMMKTSGYRVSPSEVEEILYATRLVGECAAFGVAHPTLGQTIQVVATPPPGGPLDAAALLAACRQQMPAYMIPAAITPHPGPLPRNPNGKIDRVALRAACAAKAAN